MSPAGDDNHPAGPIRVELVFVHLSNEGEKTYELQFVDAGGVSSPQLVVGPFGTLRLATDEETE